MPLRLEVLAQDGAVTARLFGALRPKKRWISTQATRSAHSSLRRPLSALLAAC